VFILFVNVDEAFLAHHAKETPPAIHLLGEKDGRTVMVCTVDGESGVRHFLFRVNEESVVHDVLGDVACQVLGFLSVVL
jgi:hypothetical protein